MLPIRVGKSEQDMGVCVATICPHCQRRSQFHLRQRSAALYLFGQAVAHFGGTHEFMCSLCKFRKEIPNGELSAAQAAQRLFVQLEARELNSAQYAEALEALDFPSLHALRDEAATWSCPVCKEKVPATLNGCWKCNSPRPGLLGSDSPKQDELPRLPNAVTRPSNPWEQ